MNIKLFGLTTLITACSIPYGIAQVATQPSAPVPYPGLINSEIRSSDPSLSDWDFGINLRLRDDNKVNAGTTDAGSNWDFSKRPVDDNQNHFEVLRLMPRIGYVSPWVSVLVETRTSYSFGDERYNATAPGHALADDDGPIDIYQAYVLIGDLKEFPVTMKIGRQELTYGDQRLVGPAKWLNNPRSFDAAKLHYQNETVGMDVFTSSVVYIQDNHLNESNSQDLFSGVYITLPQMSEHETVETYLLAHNVQRGIVTDNWSDIAAPSRFPAPQDIYTAGLRFKSKPKAYGAWDYTAEGMYQFGNRTAVFPGSTVAAALAAPRLKQEAFALILQAGYTFIDQWATPRIALVYSYASGDKNPNDDRSETFQNLYPSNHGLYGNMDLSGLQNLKDLRLTYAIKPTPTLSFTFEGHIQRLDNTNDFWYNAADVPRNFTGATVGSGKGYRINPSYNDSLGQELDLVTSWTPTKYTQFDLGLSHFFRGQYVKQSLAAVGSNDANYLYVQVTLNL